MSRIAFAPRAMACVVGIVLLLSECSAFAQADPNALGLEIAESKAAPELNEKFRPKAGWIGGEGAHSIELGNNRTLWLFGDTWVGAVKDGRRSQARIVHNSAGVQCGPDAPCTFFVREDATGKPVDLVTPEDGRGWFWFQSGIVVRERLYLFMSQLDRPSSKIRPDRTPLGQWLVIVDNPQEDPREWCIRQVRMPFAYFSRIRDVTYGSGAVVEGEHLYVFGCDDAARQSSQNRLLIVARVPVDRIEEMSQWKFLRKGRWSRDFMRADHIGAGMSSDLSISYMPGLKRYLMVYTEFDISNRIVARTAPSPIGPWSSQETLHSCLDAYGDQRLYCYSGKAHPSLSSDGKLVISYLTSSTDTWQVSMNAQLYWPTFVSVGIRDAQREPTGTVAAAKGNGGED
jgi:hypothetical protein